MNCAAFQEKLRDMARGREDAAALDHVRECEECERALLNQRTLSAGLRAIAANEAAAPSRELEAELLAHFDSPGKSRKVSLWWAVPAFAGLMAVLAWLWMGRVPQQVQGPERVVARMPEAHAISAPVVPTVKVAARRIPRRVKRAVVQPVLPPEPEAPFTPIPYAAPLQATERAEIVRVNLSATALASIGIPVWGADPAMRVNAELVLGENGLARAVRLVNSDERIKERR